ncbi:deoxypodophyllotoxin synthase-like [Bidens hawaiensis]|uniref:deoxypodophyllotoxin synthase-like n=1 Tax=Bidens hawaiensis TaxID=980011 RepID=UPI0040491952
MASLPIINLSVNELNSSLWATTCRKVTHALEEYGCFIAKYDGVSSQLHDAIFVASQQVLDLPHEVKMLNTSEEAGHGYMGKFPENPSFERLSIENATTKEGVEMFTKLMWPSGNDTFCEPEIHLKKTYVVVAGKDLCVLCFRVLLEYSKSLKAWTNGRMETPFHRVMMQGKKDRFSMVVSSYIRDLKIQAPQELVDEDHPMKDKPFDHYKYINFHTYVNARKLKYPLKVYCGL